VYSASGNSVETVVIDGRIVMENREIKTMDEEKILARVKKSSEEVLKRTGVSPFNTRWKVV